MRSLSATAWVWPIAVSLVSAALGTVADRLLGLDLDGLGLVPRWAARIIVCWALVYLWVLSAPLALLVAAVLIVVKRSGIGGPVPFAGSALPSHRLRWTGYAALAMLVLVVVSRGPALIYWDENAYMARAAWGSAGLAAIRDRTLDPDPLVLTRGYPIFWAIPTAVLSGLSSQPFSLLLAGSAAFLVIAILYVGLCTDRVRAGEPFALLAIAGVIGTPLSFVHARSLYADLPLGLLVGAWTLLITGGRSLGSIALIGIALGGMKDEGITAALAGLIAVSLVQVADVSRRRRLAEIGTVGSALLFILIWKWWSPTSGIPSAGHTFAAVHWDRIDDIALRGFLRHASDVYSWGVVWAVAAGAIVSAPWTWMRLSPDTRFLGVFVVLHAVGNFGAIAVAPTDVVEHVTVLGIVANRLLIQELPAVLVFLSMFVRDLQRAPITAAQSPL